ncbi:gluconokinase [Salmonella enterica]|uniref:Gluconokinase n=1 Tax=Salmonella enterica subsp. houtenae serovar 45:g,z51:- TaxID=1967611 RepID=A0A753B8Y7_SALHO|nr:gluconokinase [Salmonella enterica]EAB6273459.1 gluconokinase [Salmonella enterica subsp. houtenae]EBP3940092.1 gluconokinase [Salmonella enterica subsp. enterica]ECT8413735.1 gluconokinase [Salmonella enterica subsp. houtenae serovar 45:g,z51:-]EHF3220903.1 gluconokinase [Salmonella enterica subsp. houtenae serovar Houten]HAF0292749.1 gluconokinase [Salmonella enterica subsp. houtenae serovar 43:z4,z32:-]
MNGDFETDVEVIFQKNENGFIVCSSLKKQYRDILRLGSPNVHFLWLDGDYETILAPMQRRAGHFMPVVLLKSQFDALECPQEDERDIARIDVNHDIEHVTEQCRQAVLAFRNGQ